MESKVSSRIEWLDVAKGIAAFLVIMGHTVSNGSPIRNAIFSFHMPLFFILAGYTFKQKQWPTLIRSSFKRLAIPYLLIIIVWNLPHFLMTTKNISLNSVADILLTIIFASGTSVPRLNIDAVGMSWFLMALFFSRIVFNGILTVSKNAKHPVIHSFVASVGSCIIGMYVGSNLGIYLPFSFDVSLVGTFFMWTGYCARHYVSQLKTESLVSGAISGAIWLFSSSNSSLEMAARIYSPSIFSIIAALSGTYLLCWVSIRIARIKTFAPLLPIYKGLLYCGKNSMGIYCIHALDWWIPWSSFPSLTGIPFPNLLRSILRFIYSLSYCKLMNTLR